MVLTPEEIQSREFLVSLRGYDRDEVHAFLDEVAEAFAELLASSAGDGRSADGGSAGTDAAEPVPSDEPAEVAGPAAPEPAPLQAPVSPFAAIGAETQRILDAAQEAGEQIMARAEQEANRAREEALAQAETEVTTLRDQAASTQRAIDVLELRQAEVSDRLRQARDTAELALMEVAEASRSQDADAADASTAAPAPADEPAALDDDAPARKRPASQGALIEDTEDEA